MIFFLYGPDTYRSRQKLRELTEKFLRDVDPSGVNLVRLNGETMSIDDVHIALVTQSMFAKKRMVIIEDVLGKGKKDVQEHLAAALEKKEIPEEHIVVFWEGEIKESKNQRIKKSKKKSVDKRALAGSATQALRDVLLRQKYVQEFQLLKPPEVQKWCAEEIRKQGGVIDRSALQLLVVLTGGDLWRLSQEIHKLIAHAAGAQTTMTSERGTLAITQVMVEEFVHGDFESNMFALTDALALRSKKQARQLLYRELRAGTPVLYILSMVVRQYRILLQVADAIHAGISARALPETLKLHPFVVEKARQQVTHYTFEELKNIYHQLLEIDVSLKTTRIRPQLLFDLLIARL